MTPKPLVERLRNEPPWGPQFEIIAPEGFRFVSGSHSLICVDRADVKHRLASEPLEACPIDCDCKFD